MVIIKLVFKNNKLNQWLLSLIICISQTALASDQNIAQAYKYLSLGDYKNVIKTLKKNTDQEPKNMQIKYYLMGLAYNKTQEYDKAVKQFILAIKVKAKYQDIHYEFGQALYATNNLEHARLAFKRSYKKRHLPAASLYYVAHISQILNQNKLAKKYYNNLLRSKPADKTIRQIGRFQLTEVLYEVAKTKKNPKKYVVKYILPQLKTALSVLPQSNQAAEIKARIKELEEKYNLTENSLFNGKKYSEKKYSLSIKDEIAFDSNVTLGNEKADQTQTELSSVFNKFIARGKYRFIYNKKYVITPKIMLGHYHYLNNDVSIKSNNEYYYKPSLMIEKAHLLKLKPASLKFNYTYQSKNKDYLAQDKKIFYYNSHTLDIAESFNYFNFGETTFKLGLSLYNYYDETPSLNRKEYSVSLDQLFNLKNNKIIILFLEYDMAKHSELAQLDYNLIVGRLAFSIPRVFYGWFLSTSVNYTNLKFKTYSTNNYSPAINFSKTIFAKTKLAFGVVYNRNIVTSATNDTTIINANEYSKYTLKFSLKISL